MAQDEIKKIWQITKQRYFPENGKFLHYWVLTAVFAVPLLIFNYGFGATAIRQIALFVLVGSGFLIWLSPVVLGKQKIVWRRSFFTPIALVFSVFVLASSFFSGAAAEIWGWRGVLAENNPWRPLKEN